MNATPAGIPDDDQIRTLTVADPDAPGARHIIPWQARKRDCGTSGCSAR
jgi:phosphatidylethanolamine-binding protein (PEBP) family uncharacterized protein